MKKILFVLMASSISTQAFAAANTFELLSSQRSNLSSQDFCTKTMSVDLTGSTVTLSMHPDLGADFNIDGQQGDVVINKVNQGSVTEKRKSFAHGETIKSEVEATLVNGVLNVDSTTKFSYGIIPNGKATANLKIVFSKTGLELVLKRAFNDLGSSSDWETSQVCSYKLVK